MKVSELCRRAMVKAGILSAGEPIAAQDAGDAKETLRLMLDGWANERLMIPVTTAIKGTLPSGHGYLSIGMNPDPLPPATHPVNHIQTPQPQDIEAIWLDDGSGTDYPLSHFTAGDYACIDKTVQATPSYYYIREGWPSCTLLFNAIADRNFTVHIEGKQPLLELIPNYSMDSNVELPPGYERAIIYNLAVELAMEYGSDAPPGIAILADDAKRKIKAKNFTPVKLTVPKALQSRHRRFDINSGPGGIH